MKNIIKAILIITILCNWNISLAQTLNWSALKTAQKNLFNIHAGIEHGLTGGFGYGYQLSSARPIVLYAEYSMPAGKNLFDDFKTKAGASMRFYKFGDFQFSGKLYSVFRRYQSDFVRLVNFGGEASASIGYYKPKWFVASEITFDKAIITHFKHSDSYREIYPQVKDGWYEPPTGGNLYLGLQTGISFMKMDYYLKAGKVMSEKGQPEPIVPLVLHAGMNIKIVP